MKPNATVPRPPYGPHRYGKNEAAGDYVIARAVIPYSWHERLVATARKRGCHLDDLVREGLRALLAGEGATGLEPIEVP